MPGGIAIEDIEDSDLLSRAELLSDGTLSAEYLSASCVSTSNALQQVTVSGVDLLLLRDTPLEDGDKVVLAGSTAADGTYTINAVMSAFIFSVYETIPDSTGGTLSFRYPAGASQIGLDASSLVMNVDPNLQAFVNAVDQDLSYIPVVTEDGFIVTTDDGFVVTAQT